MFAPVDLSVPIGTRWGFVAMQYHTLILNRVVVVCVGTESLVALVVRGPVAAPIFVRAKMYDPLWWVRRYKLKSYVSIKIEDDAVLGISRANYRISFSDIASVNYSADEKGGMGSVPYSGRILLGLPRRQREFILIGTENGESVRTRLDEARREWSGT